MATGIAVRDGTTVIHKLLNNGLVSLSGSVEVTGSILPDQDNGRNIGSDSNRWQDIYAVQTTVGAIFEYGLQTKDIGKNETGTVVCWHNGKLVPCEIEGDSLVMGVIQKGKDQPIIMGAEDILVTGKIKEGDFLITSSKKGHCMSAPKEYFSSPSAVIGTIIGQALESCESDSKLIKCMIGKR